MLLGIMKSKIRDIFEKEWIRSALYRKYLDPILVVLGREIHEKT